MPKKNTRRKNLEEQKVTRKAQRTASKGRRAKEVSAQAKSKQQSQLKQRSWAKSK
jgi:hypothetical protein